MNLEKINCKSILSVNPTPVVIYDSKGRVVYINSKFTEVFKWTFDEIEGKKIDFVPKGERKITNEAKKEVHSNKSKTFEFQTKRYTKTKDVLDVIINAIVFESSGEIGTLVYFNDITERRRFEDKIAIQTKRYHEFINLLPETVIFYEMDKNGVITFINPDGLHVLGYSEDDLGNIKFSDCIKEVDKGMKNVELLKSGKPTKSQEYTLIKEDGSTIPVSIYSAPVIDKTGFNGARGVILDNTEQKEIEKKQRQSQKLEAIGTLAGGIAHDFNNILMALNGYNQFCLKATESDEQMQKWLTRCKSSLDRAGELVRQILTFSRQTEFEKKPVMIGLFVKEVCNLLRASLPKTIEIKVDVFGGSYVTLADPTNIHQVIMNLCTNSLHAMEKTGGILKLSLMDYTNPETIGSFKKGNYVLLKVEDTGEGIETKIKEKIFDPFFTTKELDRGTGMGLSVVLGIVKDLNGHIEVKSDKGSGTCFYVYFPVIGNDIEVEIEKPEEDVFGSESIIIVDDEETILYGISEYLVDLGYEISIFTNPIEALEVFRKEPEKYRAIVSDMTMKEMTGRKLFGETDLIKKDVVKVIMTGYSTQISKKEANALGWEYLEKPFSALTLAALLRKNFDA